MSMTIKKNLAPVQKWRRQNLEIAIREHGSIAEVARKTGLSDSYLSQIRNRTRTMGNPTAEKLERGLGLEEGAFSCDPDQVREPSPEYGEKVDEKLQRVIDAWPSLTEKQRDEQVRNITGLERSNKELLKDLLSQKKTG